MFFYLAGIYVAWLAIQKTKLFYLPSILLFILAIYSYNSFRLILPLIILIFAIILLITNRVQVYKSKVFILSFLILIISFIPIYRLYCYDSGLLRYTTVGLSGSLLQKALIITKNLISHFSPSFLFFDGDSNLRSNLPRFGELYAFSLPFLLVGFFDLVKKKSYLWIIAFCILGIVPAAITKESPHSLRSLASFPFFILLITFGIKSFVDIIPKWKKLVLTLIIIVYTIYFSRYLNSFFGDYNKISQNDWQMAYKRMIKDNLDNEGNKTVIIPDTYGQPYIFVLYYLKIPVNQYLSSVSYNDMSDWGFSKVASFGQYIFVKDK